MPTSPSRRRRVEAASAPARRRAYWPLIPLAILIAAAVLFAALPAAVLGRLLPPEVRLREVSGTVWHGVAGGIRVDGRDAGAVEWRLHPLALLRGAADLDLRWVDRGLSAEASATVGAHELRARGVRAGGPIADLGALGIASGWRGTATLRLQDLATDYRRIETIEGELRVADLASPRVAAGANLGGYRLLLGGGGGTGDALSARVEDTGGPVRLRANLSVDLGARRGTISGTLSTRPGAPAPIVAEVDQLAQMRGRDAAGDVPIELEFTF